MATPCEVFVQDYFDWAQQLVDQGSDGVAELRVQGSLPFEVLPQASPFFLSLRYQPGLILPLRDRIIRLPARFVGTETLFGPPTEPETFVGPPVGDVNVQISYGGPLAGDNSLHVNIKLRNFGSGRSTEFGFVPHCSQAFLQGIGNPNDVRTLALLFVLFKQFVTPPK